MKESKISILIIEDNPLNAAQIVNIVNDFTDDITVSTTAERGFTIFKQAFLLDNPFDILISDIILPGKSGKELIREIRELEDENNVSDQIKIIAASAESPQNHLLEIFRIGAEHYIEKPVTKEKLTQALLATKLFP